MSKKSSRSTSDRDNNIRDPKSGSGSNPGKQWDSVLETHAEKENTIIQADSWTSIPTQIMSDNTSSEEKIVKEYQIDSVRESENSTNDKPGKKAPPNSSASEENFDGNDGKTGNKPKRGFRIRKDF